MADVAKIKEVFEKNLREALKKETQEKLGDRTKYIGASDISGCLRAAYFNKTNPVELPIEKLLIFERGHNTELIIEKMLGNMPYKREVEFETSDEPYPARVHLDYVVINKKEKSITIIEVKSQNNDNFTVYPSYLLQVNFQWLVADTVLKNKGWKVKNAFVIMVNNNSGKYEVVEVEKDEELQKIALEKAKALRAALIKKEAPEGEEQLYCSQCPYKSGCPTFCKGAVNDFAIAKEAEEVMSLEKEIKKLQAIVKEKKEKIKQYLEVKGVSKVKAGEHIVSITAETSYKTIDTQKLKKENEDLYKELLEKYGKEVKRSSSLKIK